MWLIFSSCNSGFFSTARNGSIPFSCFSNFCLRLTFRSSCSNFFGICWRFIFSSRFSNYLCLWLITSSCNFLSCSSLWIISSLCFNHSCWLLICFGDNFLSIIFSSSSNSNNWFSIFCWFFYLRRSSCICFLNFSRFWSIIWSRGCCCCLYLCPWRSIRHFFIEYLFNYNQCFI